MVPGKPRAKARPRFSSRFGPKRLHSDPKGAAYEAAVALAAKEALGGHPPIDGPLEVDIRVAMQPAPSLAARKRSDLLRLHWAPRRPDLDNVIKAVLDGCCGAVFTDDSAICKLAAEKFYGAESSVNVQVKQL